MPVCARVRKMLVRGVFPSRLNVAFAGPPMTSFRSARLALRSAAFALLALVGFACADPAAPTQRASAPSALLGLPLGGGDGLITVVDTTVNVLQRTVPLLTDVTTSATIGPEGGSIYMPSTGFRLDVPKNAVAAPTTITVTAVAGTNVAYEFQPAGMVFSKRLVATQDLSATTILPVITGTNFVGAYFRSRDQLYSNGTALVNELEPTTVDLPSLNVRFTIGHFSGYIVAVD